MQIRKAPSKIPWRKISMQDLENRKRTGHGRDDYTGKFANVGEKKATISRKSASEGLLREAKVISGATEKRRTRLDSFNLARGLSSSRKRG